MSAVELRLCSISRLPPYSTLVVYVRSEERRIGKDVSVRVDLGGRRIIKKITKIEAFLLNYTQ